MDGQTLVHRGTGPVALRLHHVSKTFAGQRALDDVSFDLQRAAVTALLGMNGSGKSTLIKVLAGAHAPDHGSSLEIDGADVPLPLTPATAHAAGLRFLHQEIGLVPALTISDNFAFADRFRSAGVLAPIRTRQQHDHVARVLAQFGVDHHPGTLVSDLGPTSRTMVALARAFQDDDASPAGGTADRDPLASSVLVLDEPTASLPAEEVESLLLTVEALRRRGGTIVYVSHRTEEVHRLADQIIVLRDGRLVADVPRADLGVDDIVALVVGQRLTPKQHQPAARRTGRVVLEARGLQGPRLRGVDIDIRAGEVLGVAGLVGCGRSELMRLLSGSQRPTAGALSLQEEAFAPRSPADALAAGIALVPQDRRGEGCVLPMSVQENLTMGDLGRHSRHGVLSRRREAAVAGTLVADFRIKAAGLDQPIALLSGGNQQKVVVARAADRRTTVLLLDEPTQGVDALAKQEIWNIVRQMADEGCAVVLASTDVEEFVGLCDRVLVLDRGLVVATATGRDIDAERLTALCAGGSTAA